MNSKIGTFSIIDGVVATEILSEFFDFIILDSEHGLEGYAEQRARYYSLNRDIERFIRVPNLSKIDIQRFLEIKPDGILIPQISKLEDVALAIDSFYYPPIGKRGISPYTRQFGYMADDVEGKKQQHNTSCKLCLLVEGEEGINNMQSIIDKYSQNIHMIYFGLFDYANAMKCKPDLDDPKVKQGINNIINICKTADVKVGTIARSKADIGKLKSLGCDYIVYKNDSEIMIDGIRNALS